MSHAAEGPAPESLRLNALAGDAVFDTVEGWLVPGVYSTEADAVASEYAAARDASAVLDLSDRGLLSVAGPDRLKFLHNILSNDVKDLAPGQGRRAALMDLKGHVLAFLRVLVEAQSVVLEMTRDSLPTVEGTLEHYRVGSPVRFSRREDVVLALLGPKSGEIVGGLEGEAHRKETLGGEGVVVVGATDLPVAGCVIHVPPTRAAAVFGALAQGGSKPMGRRALDALRVEAGRAWYGRDVTSENLLHETGLVAEYHSSTKGCYVGQEVIARLEARGARVNKKLVGLSLSAPVPPASRVSVDGEDVGRITTPAISPRLGPIALAYVHRDRAEPGVAVECASARGVVTRLPFP